MVRVVYSGPTAYVVNAASKNTQYWVLTPEIIKTNLLTEVIYPFSGIEVWNGLSRFTTLRILQPGDYCWNFNL